jgi:hypothetical protein
LGDEPRVRALPFVAALLIVGCGPSSGGNDGGTDGGNSTCDGAAKSPPNLIHDNGFECADQNTADWSSVFGTLDFPTGSAHTGSTNARITAGSNGDARFAYNLDVADNAGMSTICLNAYVKGTTPFMRMRLLTSGGSTMEYDFSAPGGSSWQRAPPSVGINLDAANLGAMKMQLVFESQVGRSDGMNSVAGDTLEIDDVDAWISTDGHCRER